MSDKLIALFAEELGVDPSELSDGSNPDTVESWDSLAAMRLVAAIESEFDVTLSGKEVMKMRTIGIAREVLAAKGVTF
ncbi:acyl carrier protein [Rhizobium terricola]|uniref:Acyl carrier protein n=1 Tax=Rhizobium terricola TaxID=2728849 RepID=A0A7Y0FWN3_9HYPH|nr:acyl carrier protein [Rhizobium terricola]NML75703.1 acyl carrier protein [Rhizobium terricola]